MAYEWRRETGTAAREERVRAGNDEVRRAAGFLLGRQSPEGFWCGELTADSTLESDYILLQLWLHQPDGARWDPPSRSRVERAARTILSRQLPDGGFNIY